MAFKFECGAVLANNILIDVQQGTSGGVGSKFLDVWEYWKTHKSCSLILMHTHPNNCFWLSKTDESMLAGWCKTFPVPIISIVISMDTSGKYEKLISTAYMSYESNGVYTLTRLGHVTNINEMLPSLLVEASHGDTNSFNMLEKRKYQIGYNPNIKFDFTMTIL